MRYERKTFMNIGNERPMFQYTHIANEDELRLTINGMILFLTDSIENDYRENGECILPLSIHDLKGMRSVMASALDHMSKIDV